MTADQKSTPKKTILAIDDSATQLKVFEKLLGAFYDLTLAKSAPEALALIDNDKLNFDLILLDIEMPDVSGFEFLHTIRKIPRYMTKPIVIVTGHSDSDILAHAENSSASGVLIKPVESGQLHGAVEKALCTPAKKPFDL